MLVLKKFMIAANDRRISGEVNKKNSTNSLFQIAPHHAQSPYSHRIDQPKSSIMLPAPFTGTTIRQKGKTHNA